MIGEIITIGDTSYSVIDEMDTERVHSEIFLCKDANDSKFVIKRFLKTPSANVGLSVYNHYGRRRDGSSSVFSEIQHKSKEYDFIIDHYHRVFHNGYWLIILEYIPGETLYDFMKSKINSNKEIVIDSIRALGKTLGTWHSNGFAHGDPHLENAMLTTGMNNEQKIVLIDYCHIHHKDFHYCKEYECCEPDPLKRIREDLNNQGKLGKGFRKEILDFQNEYNLDNTLVETFDKSYRENINFEFPNEY